MGGVPGEAAGEYLVAGREREFSDRLRHLSPPHPRKHWEIEDENQAKDCRFRPNTIEEDAQDQQGCRVSDREPRVHGATR